LDKRDETSKDITEEKAVKDSDELTSIDSPETRFDSLKTQYDQLSEDWRHFNNILWGIPAVAVSIMAGIIVVAYQPELDGWPRFVSLTIGALFLFALTIEVIKKRVHLNAISDLLNELQGPKGLKLKPDFNFPVGLSEDVEDYWAKKHDPLKKEEAEVPRYDLLFYSLRRSSARGFLAYVTFIATIAVGILAVIALTGIIIHCYNFPLPCE
jgi:hypothetical protein